MLRRILVAQLLTVLLDAQGTDPNRLMEAFPEEFGADRRGTACAPKAAFPSSLASSAWSSASEDLTDALLFLVDRQLVSIQEDGRAVPALSHDSREDSSLDVRDDGFEAHPAYGWNEVRGREERVGPFDFENRRFES